MSDIKKNYLYSICYQILIMALPLITSPYISRVMGVEGVGIFSYTYSIVSYFMLFSMLGVANYGNRAIAQVRDSKEEVSFRFWSIYSLQIITGIISLSLYFILINNFDQKYIDVLKVLSLSLISSILDINWLYFGFEQFKLTISRNIIIKIISVGLIFLFVKTKDDLLVYAFIIGGSNLLSQIILWVFIKDYVNFSKPSIESIVAHIKPNLILFIPVIAVSIYTIMDKIMLNRLGDIRSLGLYENAQKITIISTGIITSLGSVMLPRMSNLYSKKENSLCDKYISISMEFVIILATGIAFGIAAIAPTFTPIFFGQEFSGSSSIMVLLSYATIPIAWANVIRTQYLIPNNKDKVYLISVILGAIMNLSINLILIPMYGALGAAIGTIVAEVSVAFCQTFWIRRNLSIMTYLKDTYSFIGAGIIMFLVVRHINIKILNPIPLLICEIIVGFFVYITCVITILYVKKSELTIFLKSKNYKGEYNEN